MTHLPPYRTIVLEEGAGVSVRFACGKRTARPEAMRMMAGCGPPAGNHAAPCGPKRKGEEHHHERALVHAGGSLL